MIAYSVCVDDLAPCAFKHIDDALQEAKMHLIDANMSEVSITIFEIKEDEYESLPEHKGY